MGQPSGGWSKSMGDEKKRGVCTGERVEEMCVCLGTGMQNILKTSV